MTESKCSQIELTKWYKIKGKYRDVKFKLGIFLHSVFWRILWATRTAIAYSKFACENGFYRKYSDGRCHYCGKKHK